MSTLDVKVLFAPVLVVLSALVCGVTPNSDESISSSAEALSAAGTRVLGFESVGDWTASSGQLSVGSRHIQGSASLSIANPGSSTITSRALGTLGPDVGSLIGFDLQIPEVQPDPYWFGSVQVYVSIPSRSINNVLLGQRELTYMPRGIFRRIEFPLTSALQTTLKSTYSDLRFSVVLHVPQGAGPYLLDRMSFTHAESELVDNSRNAAILGFEASTAWTISAGSLGLTGRRTEKANALAVTPAGYSIVTSDRLATPSNPSASVGFDLHVPRVQPNPDWYGEAQLFVELPPVC